MRRDPIAVIGIGCRFPGAHGPDALWAMLDRRGDPIGPTPPYRAPARSGLDPRAERPETAARGSLDDVEAFDWGAFRMSPRESRYVDPQQRLLLEVAWESLEHAGLPLGRVAGTPAGVFVGIMWPDYAKLLAENPSQLAGYAASGTGFALAANRLSHFFDLRGPSVALDVQCASSLVAIHLACASIWSGDCTFALAGGVNLILTPDSDLAMARAGILSRTGRCMPFAAAADGFVRSEGAGVVVLKPLAAAAEAGDRVLAVILGTAANHDGRRAPLTAPAADSQAELIETACGRAGIDPADLDYVELHGTGTQRGDPIEADALGRTVGARGARSRPCLVGSIKSNIGHAEAAAGVAAVIKTVLAVHHRRIPPMLHYGEPSPAIPLERLGLAVVDRPVAWPRGGRRALAGVTGLSLGGGNAHVVIGAAPPPAARAEAARRWTGPHILPLSARTPEALLATAEAYEAFIRDPASTASLRDVCFTSSTRRTHHAYRLAVVGHSRRDLSAQLAAHARLGAVATGALPRAEPAARSVVYVFPSHAALAARAAARLSAGSDELAAALRRHGAAEADDDRSLRFALQVTLAGLWSAWGVSPTAIVASAASHAAATHVADLCGVGRVGRLEDGAEFAAAGQGELVEMAVDPRRPWTTLLHTLARLYAAGTDIAWERVHPSGSVVTLPTYPWQRERLWIDPEQAGDRRFRAQSVAWYNADAAER